MPSCPTVNSCCFCIPLKVGGIIMGVADMLFLIMLISYDGYRLNAGPALNSTHALNSSAPAQLLNSHALNSSGPAQVLNLTAEQILNLPEFNEKSNSTANGTYVPDTRESIIISIVINCFGLVLNICWLTGIFKEIPRLLIPTIFISLLRFTFRLCDMIHTHGILTVLGLGVHWIDYVQVILVFYFWIVEYSVYKLIKDTVEGRKSRGRNDREAESRQLN